MMKEPIFDQWGRPLVSMGESAAASHIRLDAAQLGNELWRNNVGVAIDETGRAIRYGLCNDSAPLLKKIKSSDYIGLTPVFITPDMIGSWVGVFTAVETKPSDWKFPRPTNKAEYERCVAQLAFHDIVRRGGGYAGFATCPFDYRKIIQR